MHRSEGIQAIVGEVVPYAGAVLVCLDSGEELRSEIVRSAITFHDYFVAFGPEEPEVQCVVATDEDGGFLGKASRSGESIRSSRDFRQRVGVGS